MYEADSFTGRLNKLLSESGLTIDKFAAACHVSRAGMQNYINGDRIPNGKVIIDICKAFSVTADWLLALSDVRTPSADVQTVVETLGLSEEAIQKIMDPDDIGHCKDALSHLIEQDGFFPLIADYKVFLTMVDKFNYDDSEVESEFDYKTLTVTLSLKDTINLWRTRIADQMKNICKSEPIIPEAIYDTKTGWRYPKEEVMEKIKRGEKINIKEFI